jgi:hypothetical protein
VNAVGFNPLYGFANTIKLAAMGKIHFPKTQVGEILQMEDGERFEIFRHVVVDQRPGGPVTPDATFKVGFHTSSISRRRNELYSWITMLFIVGLPGFRSKRWMVEERKGDRPGLEWRGIYEWDTTQEAESYASSFAMRFMKNRSTPGSVSHEISPGKAEVQELVVGKVGM